MFQEAKGKVVVEGGASNKCQGRTMNVGHFHALQNGELLASVHLCHVKPIFINQNGLLMVATVNPIITEAPAQKNLESSPFSIT